MINIFIVVFVEGKGLIKCSSIVVEDGNTGVSSAVCRDSNGLFLGSSALVIPGLISPSILDAVACREAQAGSLRHQREERRQQQLHCPGSEFQKGEV